MYSFINKLIEKNGPIQPNQNILAEKLKNIKDIEEFHQSLKSGEHYGFPAEIVIKLIDALGSNSQSGAKDNKYREAIRGLERELKEKSLNAPEKYMQRIKELEKQLSEKEEFFNLTNRKNEDDTEFKIKIKDLNAALDKLKSENESLNLKLKQNEVKYTQLELKYKESESKCQSYKEELSIKNSTGNEAKYDGFNPEYYIKMLKDIENNYKEKILNFDKENLRLNSEVCINLIYLFKVKR